MSNSTSIFSRLKLRSKLLLLAALPLAALLVTAGLLIASAQQDRSEALNEQAEIDRVTAAAALADSLAREQDSYLRSNTIQSTISVAQLITDEALEAYGSIIDGSVGEVTELDELRTDLELVRSELTGADQIREMQQMALVLGRGDAFETFEQMDQIVDRAFELVKPATGSLGSNEANVTAQAIFLLTNYDASLRAELRAYVEIREAADQLAADVARSRAFKLTGEVEQAEDQIADIANAELQAGFEALTTSPTYFQILSLRTRIAGDIRDASLAPRASSLPTYDPVFRQVDELQAQFGVSSTARAEAAADAAELELFATTSAMAVVVVLLAMLVIALFRAIRAPLLSLTERSRQVAQVQLPNTVAQIRELGGSAVVEMPDPIVAESDDEIAELVDAFNQLHSTAVELAAEQASSRRTVSEMFVNLGRRNQKILMRLLSSLEKLERDERDPEVLRQLFMVDHLATRMRRNAESLLVLAGAKTSRSFGQSVAVGDVVRAALSEVEDYERVQVVDESHAKISGKAVADIAHLLAELIENALMFSPPSTNVDVIARADDGGSLSIFVMDRGIGLSAEELDQSNKRIVDAAQLTETPSRFLGLYVVGRLANRHQLTVTLAHGQPGGLVARIDLSDTSFELPTAALEAPGSPAQSAEAVVSHDPALTPLRSGPSETSPLSSTVPADASAITPAHVVHAPVLDTPPAPAHRRVVAAPVGLQPQPQIQPQSLPEPQPQPQPSAAPMPQRHPQAVQQAPDQQPMPRRQPQAQPQPQPQVASVAEATVLPQRVPSRAVPNATSAVSATEPSARIANSNQSLAGFQRGTQSASQPDGGRSLAATAPQPHAPPAPHQAPQHAPQIPAAPVHDQTPTIEAASGGFSVQRRVPGASSLSQRSADGGGDRRTTPQPTSGHAAPPSSAQGAAHVGASLAGFQQGVKRADTKPTPNEDLSSPSGSSPSGTNGEPT